MYCGAALSGSRGETPSLPFLCRRFFSQTEKKCRNAGNVYHLIIVRGEGRSQLSTIRNCYNFISASPIADSRKGCHYGVLKFGIWQHKISRFCAAIPQSRLTPSQLPLHKGAEIKFYIVIKIVFKSWL